jgi:hypothetical protein
MATIPKFDKLTLQDCIFFYQVLICVPLSQSVYNSQVVVVASLDWEFSLDIVVVKKSVNESIIQGHIDIRR